VIGEHTEKLSKNIKNNYSIMDNHQKLLFAVLGKPTSPTILNEYNSSNSYFRLVTATQPLTQNRSWNSD
jgi:hypothetical protein